MTFILFGTLLLGLICFRVWKPCQMLRVADQINAALERHFWLCAALFIVPFLACSIARDVRTKMWIDELYTLHMAQQASP